ncbi:MAG: tyrosine-type recombinase/integrase [Lachnospiraceae bacterium]|nr:tyrosine-type recombinase/integrase [Lachnospiraceae bacterium]
MSNNTYHQNEEIHNVLLMRNILQELPKYVSSFFRSIEYTKAPRTRLGYARDLKSFYEYLCDNNPALRGKQPLEVSLEVINQLEAEDIEEYLEYMKVYEKDGRQYTNGERALKRKLATIRVFFNYLYKNRRIDANPSAIVDMPKIHEKAIVRMDANEVAQFLDNVEYGNKMSNHQQKYHEKTKVRDLAMMTLMLGTGIRVSECVGLDIGDIDFDYDRIKVVRKGGYEAYVYFGEEARIALLEYLEEREKIMPVEGHENALFFSSQRKRISVRSVENMVKKYAAITTPLKKITPHKLRSTYGTSLYQQTSDIYLVADVLGHKDVNTTKKHYADIDEWQRMKAKDAVTLREKTNIQGK